MKTLAQALPELELVAGARRRTAWLVRWLAVWWQEFGLVPGPAGPVRLYLGNGDLTLTYQAGLPQPVTLEWVETSDARYAWCFVGRGRCIAEALHQLQGEMLLRHARMRLPDL